MKLKAVTVYKRTNEGWKRYIFANAAVRFIAATARKNGGDSITSRAIVRIFSQNAAVIELGDRLVLDAVSDSAPDANALTVYEISDNTGLCRAHWRISAR